MAFAHPIICAASAILLAGHALASGDPEPVSPAPSGASVLTLDEAYALAKARSPDLAILGERIAEAEANVERAWSVLKPQWTATYSYTHIDPAPPDISFPEPLDFGAPGIRTSCVEGGDPAACLESVIDEVRRVANAPPRVLDFARQDTHAIGTRVAWNVFTPGAVPLLLNAYDGVGAERLRAEREKTSFLLQVARTYYAAAAAKDAIGAAERALLRGRAELFESEEKAAVGERSDRAVVISRAVVRQAEIDRSRAENVHRIALVSLGLLIGGTAGPDLARPPEPEPPPGDGEALVTAAEETRSELKAARIALEMAARTRDEFWWSFAPTLGVFAGYRASNVAGLTGDRSQWSAGLNLTVPLYDGGRRYADLTAAESRLITARRTLESIRARIKADVERARLDLSSTELAIARSEALAEVAASRLDVERARLDVGAIRPLEVTEASDAVRDAELAMIRARMDRALAILELEHAIGIFNP